MKESRVINQNQNVDEHNRRVKNLSKALAECTGEIQTLKLKCDLKPWILKYETPGPLNVELEKFDLIEKILLEAVEKVIEHNLIKTKNKNKRKSPTATANL